MNKTDIVSLCERAGFDYSGMIPELERLGKTLAVRPDKHGNLLRANYERGILLLMLCRTFGLKRVLEFGTGRGYVSACLAGLGGVERIDTIDRVPAPEIKSLIFRAGVSTGRILFHTCETRDVKPEQLRGDFDLVFVDGSHDKGDVLRDTDLLKKVVSPSCVVVYDDYNPMKFKGVVVGVTRADFPHKLLVNTANWIFRKDANHPPTPANPADRAFGYGMVVCAQSVEDHPGFLSVFGVE